MCAILERGENCLGQWRELPRTVRARARRSHAGTHARAHSQTDSGSRDHAPSNQSCGDRKPGTHMSDIDTHTHTHTYRVAIHLSPPSTISALCRDARSSLPLGSADLRMCVYMRHSAKGGRHMRSHADPWSMEYGVRDRRCRQGADRSQWQAL